MIVRFKFKGGEETKKATRVLFQNYINGISFKSKDDEIEINFREQLQMKIIDELLKCEVVEVNCTDVTVLSTRKRKTAIKNTTKGKKTRDEKDIKDKLNEIAAGCSSFEVFARKVAEWLKMGEKEELFTQIIIVSSEIKEITIEEIIVALNQRNVKITFADEMTCCDNVSNMLNADYDLTMFSLLLETSKYKDYPFISYNYEAEETTSIEIPTNDEKMPVDKLKNILKGVDKADSIPNRIQYVLEHIGIESVEISARNRIARFLFRAIRMKDFSWENCCKAENIENDEEECMKIQISMLINDFLKSEDDENFVKMPIIEFISILQDEILFESEIDI